MFRATNQILMPITAVLLFMFLVGCGGGSDPKPILPSVTFLASAAEMPEEGGEIIISATLSKASAVDVIVNFEFSGTASASDYEGKIASLTIAAGQLQKTFALASIADSAVEGPETIVIKITSAINATCSTGQINLKIIDDDSPPVAPVVSIEDAGFAEGNSTHTVAVPVLLNRTSTQTVTVRYATSNRTAISGTDYTAISGTLTFAPGDTSEDISVVLIGDQVVEPDETFKITLSSPQNATLGDASAVITIQNDDLPAVPVISIEDASFAEGNSEHSVIVPVLLNHTSSQIVTVQYATSDLTANSGTDYIAVSSMLTFAPGDTTETIEVGLIVDTETEPDETFKITLSSPQNATLGDASAVITIQNTVPNRITVKAMLPASDGAGEVLARAEATTFKNFLIPGMKTVFDTQPLTIDLAKKWAIGEVATLDGFVLLEASIFDTSGDTIYAGSSWPANGPGEELVTLVAQIFANRTDCGQSVAYSPDGLLYAQEIAPAGEGNIGIYRVTDDQLVSQFDALPNASNNIKALAWSPDNRHLAVMYHGGTRPGAYVWDIYSGAAVKYLNDGYNNGFLHRIVFSRDNRWVYSGYFDGVAVVEVNPTGLTPTTVRRKAR